MKHAYLIKRFGLAIVIFSFAAFYISCSSKTTGRPDDSEIVPPSTATLRPTVEPTVAASTEPSVAASGEPTVAASAEPSDSPAQETQAQPEQTETPVQTDPPAQTQTPASHAPETNPDSPALLGVTEDMGQEYIDQIIFLGDSTTYGLKYYAVLSGGKETTQVWTPTSGTLTLSQQGFATIVYPITGEEIPIRDAVERALPEMMVITLGVNGVSFMDEDYFKTEYISLVNDILDLSPETKVILQSIFPIASNYEYQRDINNTKITDANAWILEIAEATGVKYLDTYSVLIGDDGFLPQAYHNGDGLHLNTDSFNLVLNYIRTHGYT
jgi:lysophospholipase L1-like esterase